MYGQDGVPEMAKYLQEDDGKPTFDISLDVTVTGESEPDGGQLYTDTPPASGEERPTHVMRSNLKHLAYS